MKPRDVLLRAREVLSDPKAWTQGQFARDADGQACEPTSDKAVCFCLMGAMRKVTGVSSAYHHDSPYQRHNWAHYRQAQHVLYGVTGRIDEFNDDPGVTHDGILAALENAIALA